MKRHVPVVVVLAIGLIFAGQNLVQAASSSATLNVVKVPASIDAKGTTDVSAKMAAFFRSVPDGSIVDLPAKARYRMDQTLELTGRHAFAINGNGATFFEGTPGDLQRSNIRIENSDGVIIYNLVLKGANPNAGVTNAAYVAAREHQHGFEILSVNNIALVNVTVTDVYGDFVYISKLPNGGWSNGVVVTGSHFARNGRQGIAATAARNVDISGNTLSDVRQATVDFEPAPQDGVDNVKVRNNDFSTGRDLFLAADGHGPVNNISVTGNRLHSETLQIWAENVHPGLRNNWTISGNSSDTSFGNPHGAAMKMTGVNGISIHDNRQPFNVGRNMVVASVVNSCNIIVAHDIRPGSVGESRISGHC